MTLTKPELMPRLASLRQRTAGALQDDVALLMLEMLSDAELLIWDTVYLWPGSTARFVAEAVPVEMAAALMARQVRWGLLTRAKNEDGVYEYRAIPLGDSSQRIANRIINQRLQLRRAIPF